MVKLVYSAPSTLDGDLDKEALAWVVRLASGESTETDHRLFRAWRDCSPAHRDALGRARLLWTRLGVGLPAIEAGAMRKQKRMVFAKRLAVAASVVLVVAASSQYMSTWRYDQVTSSGKQRSMVLQDGTRLTMSGETALNITYSASLRHIDIARGQVRVDVHHDAAVPFEVSAGRAVFKDVGTIFGVSRSGSMARVVVEQGIVEARGQSSKTTVLAGQSLAVADGQLGVVKAADARSELGWSRGRLMFSNRPMNEIIAALAPHYSGKIFMLNRSKGAERLSASIEIGRIDEWLDALASSRGCKVSRLGQFTFIR